MNVTVSILSDDISDEGLQDLTRDLCSTLNKESGIVARIVEQQNRVGVKGEPVTLGTILLTALGGGGLVVSLINVLKSYFERPRSFEVEIQHGEDQRIRIKAENMRSDKELARITQQVRDILQRPE